MSAEKRKQQRAKNKAKRKERRDLRKNQIEELVQKVQAAPALPEGQEPDYAKTFDTYWPIIKTALEILKNMKMTGKDLDARIEDIIALGNNVAQNPDQQGEFRDKLKNVWKYVRVVLIGITVFNKDDRHDEQIDKIVEIGDWFSGYTG